MSLFAFSVFLSAFLLFSIQPMLAKFLLPSFGGTAGVWATCLVVFQILLLAGYAYAHLLRTRLNPMAQRVTHLGILAVSLLFLPPVPHPVVTSITAATPLWELLRCLIVSAGVPFFALSATAPLLMEWFRQVNPGKSPDRLYAFSNAGSLLALLGYPLVIEPNLPRHTQAISWGVGLGCFLVICALVAWRSSRGPQTAPEFQTEVESDLEIAGRKKRRENLWLWIALPACGSALLLALTNQISQDVAPMPLLWVGPMAVYLLTFILCFESQRTYRREWFIPACLASLLGLAWLLHEGYLHGFWLQVGGYLGVLFLSCMVCHGELYRLRPRAEQLTAFYLAVSMGGALGGIFVALIAPSVFKTLAETPLIAVAIAGLVTILLWRPRPVTPALSQLDGARRKRHAHGDAKTPTSQNLRLLASAATVLISASLAWVWNEQCKESIYFTRSFYGTYRVKESPTLLLEHVNYPLTPGVARVLLSGQIYHGLQFTNAAAARTATTYYCEEGGLGFVFRELPARTNRDIGAVGLGAGTVATYAQAGDRLRFYELNPDVARIAWNHFTFLSNCAARVEVVLGDGRLSIERDADQMFDLLVLDAFAGDSIPVHLLTREAMKIYLSRLKPGGVIAIHISNSHLDLRPVVRGLGEKDGVTALMVPTQFVQPSSGKLLSVWMLLTTDREFLQQPNVAEILASRFNVPDRPNVFWTDDYSSVLPILR